MIFQVGYEKNAASFWLNAMKACMSSDDAKAELFKILYIKDPLYRQLPHKEDSHIGPPYVGDPLYREPPSYVTRYIEANLYRGPLYVHLQIYIYIYT